MKPRQAQCGINWYPEGCGWTKCHHCGKPLVFLESEAAAEYARTHECKRPEAPKEPPVHLQPEPAPKPEPWEEERDRFALRSVKPSPSPIAAKIKSSDLWSSL